MAGLFIIGCALSIIEQPAAAAAADTSTEGFTSCAAALTCALPCRAVPTGRFVCTQQTVQTYSTTLPTAAAAAAAASEH